MQKQKLIDYLDEFIANLREPYGTEEEYAAALKSAAMLGIVRERVAGGYFDQEGG